MKKITVRINDIDYEPIFGYGAQLRSIEKNLKKGDTRVINYELMYVYSITSFDGRIFHFDKEKCISWRLYKLDQTISDEHEDIIKTFFNRIKE